jgi:hypothetical protein
LRVVFGHLSVRYPCRQFGKTCELSELCEVSRPREIVRSKRGKVPPPARQVSMGFAHTLDADWRHFPANKMIGGLFFCTWIWPPTLSMPVPRFSFMDRLNVAARNFDTLRIDPAIVLSRTPLMTKRRVGVSSGNWFEGSQVSKARPGAPFDFTLRYCRGHKLCHFSPDSPQRVGCSSG